MTRTPSGRVDEAGAPSTEAPSSRRTATAVRLPASFPASIERLLSRCSVALGLLAVARTGRTLTPPQRHVLLNTFAHMGDDGRRFIHQVLAQGEDYDPDRVNREIAAVPPHPIGCQKIRRHLKLDAIEDGCNCVFRLEGNAYASPVCHLGIFPRASGTSVRSRQAPPDLDGDGLSMGYTSSRARAAARLDQLDREEACATPASAGWLGFVRRLLTGGR